MITIATFSKPEEAHLLRLRLEAGGVPAFIADENLVQMDWLLSNAVGGVRVQIDEADADRAREILAEDPDPLPASRPACPSCQSMDTAPDERPRRLSFLLVLLAGFPFMTSKTRWTCHTCGHRWNEANRAAD